MVTWPWDTAGSYKCGPVSKGLKCSHTSWGAAIGTSEHGLKCPQGGLITSVIKQPVLLGLA